MTAVAYHVYGQSLAAIVLVNVADWCALLLIIIIIIIYNIVMVTYLTYFSALDRRRISEFMEPIQTAKCT